MTRLIVTADVHGSFSTWLTLKELMTEDDVLAIAGDLFDTKFGNRLDTDFQPESILEDLPTVADRMFFVYGNCDTDSFLPGYSRHLEFNMFDRDFLLCHGHRFPPETTTDPDIVITGHTHMAKMERVNGVIHMNPGSLKKPRNRIYTYGIVEDETAKIVDIKSGAVLFSQVI
ncbi:MAG: YfcE family phosphodiesterase [Desulfarculaceae bacterium]|nr:YfcE family phosphodiesterase [Desulfarculaceae bacterium]